MAGMTTISPNPIQCKRVALIGVSHRSIKICTAVPESLQDAWQVCALWDIDERRFAAFDNTFPEHQATRYRGLDTLDELLRTEKPDIAFIATRDCHHAAPAITCLQHDVDVVLEKPMVTDCQQARDLLAAEAASRGTVQVAFNYRYQAINTTMKEMLVAESIGRVTAVELSMYLNEVHGSSFFQRWNRYRSQSGGLCIHKCGHFIDLVGWWLNQRPVEVFAYGALNYYGPDAEMNPSRQNGRHCSSCNEADQCVYHQTRSRKDAADSHTASMREVNFGKRHLNTHWYSDYQPDACIFDDDIDIEDTYSAVIRYDGGTFVNFSANFSSPFERQRIVLNGTRGRLEMGYHFASDNAFNGSSLMHYPLFSTEGPQHIPVKARPGSHGGGDPSMLEDICSTNDSHLCRASARDGAYTVAIGEALWRSAQNGGEKILITDLLGEEY